MIVLSTPRWGVRTIYKSLDVHLQAILGLLRSIQVGMIIDPDLKVVSRSWVLQDCRTKVSGRLLAPNISEVEQESHGFDYAI